MLEFIIFSAIFVSLFATLSISHYRIKKSIKEYVDEKIEYEIRSRANVAYFQDILEKTERKPRHYYEDGVWVRGKWIRG